MPDDYELNVGKFQNYINFDQICIILSSSNSAIANKIILDCLIEVVNSKRELLDLLESIATSHDFKSVINEIKSG